MAGTARLSEVARHIVQPTGIVSTGWPAVRDTCANIGWRFDGWQDGAGRLILAKRADGLYASDTVVISIPRQVGKTYLIGAIVFALCLLHPGLTVIWTAHRFKTARETFASMKAMADKDQVRPHIDHVSNARGEEGIHFRNGSRILFGARERGFGRGFAKVDVLVLDEGQILTEAAMEDMIPATNASPNPLVFLTGTPPRPKDPGEIFTMQRQEALEGESTGTLYIELSADRGCDPLDREQWAKANPSYPHRTPERSILRMRKNLPADSFVREALGVWDEISSHRALISAPAWAALSDVGPAGDVRPAAVAVDASHARQFSVGACWTGEGFSHLEEVWAGPSEHACEDWLVAHTTRRIPIVIDEYSPAASLIPRLRARGRKVIISRTADMAKACGMFYSSATSAQLTHGDQQPVNDALAGARKRAIGSAGGWGWDRRDESTDIAPLVALTLALFGASLQKRRPAGRAVSRTNKVQRKVVVM